MLWIPGMILGALFGYWCYLLVGALAQVLMAPILGYRVTQVSLLGVYVMRTGKKPKICIGEFSWWPEAVSEAKPMSYGKRVARELVPPVLGVGLETGLYLWMPFLDEFWWHVCGGTMIVLGLFLLFHLCITVNMAVNMFGKGKKAEFWRENDRVLEQIKQGIHPKELTFHCRTEEKQLFREPFHRQYDFLRYYKVLEEGDREQMKFFVEKMMPCINMDWNAMLTPMFYEVVYYMVRYEKDIVTAETYVTPVYEIMKKDGDVNGKRVYASYLYYSGKDKKLAMQVAKEGLRAADGYALRGLAYMERNLLEELIYEMEVNKGWIS